MRGLSPRVRGNQLQQAHRRPHRRSIPACAGEPHASHVTIAVSRVYPRVCGGTKTAPEILPPMSGLSPRVRGNRRLCGQRGETDRSIPACAGEPLGVDAGLGDEQVYPRVCGGTAAPIDAPKSAQGLSPRVRGNQLMVASATAAGRSIPACAGEPVNGHSSLSFAWVYPRVCGGTPAG